MPLEDDNNEISAHAFVHPNAVLGKRNIIMEGAIIREGVVIGDDNYFGPYCVIGEVPEKRGYFDKYGSVVIGNGNRFEKQVTVDSGSELMTIIHNNVIMLKNAHVGHDCQIHDNVGISCNAAVGGFTIVHKNTNIGLNATIHQRLEIPEGVMIGMNSTVTKKSILQPGRKYAGSPVKDIGPNVRN